MQIGIKICTAVDNRVPDFFHSFTHSLAVYSYTDLFVV